MADYAPELGGDPSLHRLLVDDLELVEVVKGDLQRGNGLLRIFPRISDGTGNSKQKAAIEVHLGTLPYNDRHRVATLGPLLAQNPLCSTYAEGLTSAHSLRVRATPVAGSPFHRAHSQGRKFRYKFHRERA